MLLGGHEDLPKYEIPSAHEKCVDCKEPSAVTLPDEMKNALPSNKWSVGSALAQLPKVNLTHGTASQKNVLLAKNDKPSNTSKQGSPTLRGGPLHAPSSSGISRRTAPPLKNGKLEMDFVARG